MTKLRSLAQILLYLFAGSFLAGNLIILPILIFYKKIIMPAGYLILLTFFVLFLYSRLRKYKELYVQTEDEGSGGFRLFLKSYLLHSGRSFLKWMIYAGASLSVFALYYFIVYWNLKLLPA